MKIVQFPNNIFPNKNSIFSCSHCSFTICILTSYLLYTKVMLILILIHAQYLQNNVFCFEKSLSSQNHSSSDSHHPVKNLRSKIFHYTPLPLVEIFPDALTLFGKPWLWQGQRFLEVAITSSQAGVVNRSLA